MANEPYRLKKMRTGEVKEIPLKGLSSARNDYECADGELQVCHNAVNTGDGLRPIQHAEVIDELPDGWVGLVFVHHTSQGDIYIMVDGNGNAWWKKKGDSGNGTEITEPSTGLFDEGEYQITSVGNILVINFTGSSYPGLHYYKYDANKGSYKYIGQYPPDVGLEFELMYDNGTGFGNNGNSVEIEKTGTVTADDTTQVGHVLQIGESVAVQDAVMGLVNRIVNDTKKQSKFLNPFFVRYAYRIYDGTYLMQSSPVLMVPDYSYNPTIIAQVKSNDDPQVKIRAAYRPMYLRARSNISQRDRALLENWEDIIQGIDIFITPQILNYSLTGEKLSLSGLGLDLEGKLSDSYATSSLAGGTFSISTPFKAGGGGDFGEEETIRAADDRSATRYGFFYDGLLDADKTELMLDDESINTYASYFVKGFARDGTLDDWICETYNFYKMKELTIEEAIDLGTDNNGNGTTGFSILKREGSDGIVNLTSFEQLTDGYSTRNLKMPKYIHTYNGRLNIANVDLKDIGTFPVGFISSYTSVGDVANSSGSILNGGRMTGTATVYIKDNGTVMTSVAEFPSSEEWGTLLSMPGYFFYPNPNAKYLELEVDITTDSGTYIFMRYWLPLKQHPYLYGAYYFNGYYGFTNAGTVAPDIASDVVEQIVHQTNYMYTSEVDNPFFFPSQGVNAIGTGEIVAIKSATKAMSEGTAFGAMPLYVFSTDGIWPMSVGTTGLFVATNPPSRETLLGNDPNAALQIDNSIIFLSERGLMQLIGERTTLLSGDLQERFSTFDVEDLPKWQEIMTVFRGSDNTGNILEADDFMAFIKKGARIAFDYVNYRIIVFRPYDKADEATHTAFIYDIGSKMWATMDSTLTSSVEGYPQSLVNMAGAGGGTLVGQYNAENAALVGDGKMLYTTRPLKMQKPDVMKTVRTLIERSVSHGGVKYLGLWGSRDMMNWVLIGAVKGGRMPRISGTPYKYVMVGGWSQLNINGDAISRLTFEEKDKYIDKLR